MSQLHPKDAAENNLLTLHFSGIPRICTDEKQQKWIGSDFSQVRCRKEWNVALPNNKEFQLNIQIEEKAGKVTLSEAASYPFSIANEKKEPSAVRRYKETTASSEDMIHQRIPRSSRTKVSSGLISRNCSTDRSWL